MFTNEGFARGRAEAMETRERIERRDRIERESAEAQRSRLERQSPDCSRRDFASILNGLTADRIAHERPGVSALHEIRKAQRLGQRSAASHNAEHARLEKMVGGNLGEALDRLHPGSALAKDDIATGVKTPNRNTIRRVKSAIFRRNSCLMSRGCCSPWRDGARLTPRKGGETAADDGLRLRILPRRALGRRRDRVCGFP